MYNERLLEGIIEAVKNGSEILKNAKKIEETIESKEGRANFVTFYDMQTEKFLFKELKKLLPEAVFVGEEHSKNGDFELKKDTYYFVIDPIDGTTNFICGYKHSCISVGLIYNGEVIIGVVYNPYLDELFYAERGKGSYLNGNKLSLLKKPLKEGIVSIGSSPYNEKLKDETFKIARRLFEASLDFRRSGSAALDICYVAAGRTVLYFELILSPWDFCGASLILMEAGGKLTTIEGERLCFNKKQSVLAGNSLAHSEYFTIVG